MKVCLVVHGYPPELLGGTELSVQGLARGLARQGVQPRRAGNRGVVGSEVVGAQRVDRDQHHVGARP